MNKKFIHSILIVATVAVGMGTLSSCKDDYDTWTELESQQVSLQGKIAELETQLSNLRTEQANCKSDCANEISNLKTQIANCASQADLLVLQGKVADLEAQKSRIDTLEELIKTIEGNIETLKQKLDDDVAALKGDLEGQINDVKDNLQDQIDQNKSDLQDEIDNAKNDLQDQIDDLKGDLSDATDNLQGQIDDLNDSFTTDINNLKDDLAGINERLDGHDQDLSAIESEITRIQGNISTIENKLEALSTKIDAIAGRLNKLVTGVLVQSTENPVLGSYSSPFNTQSNVVMAYYGTNTTNITSFPTIRSSQEYNGEQVITSADWAMLGKNGEAVKTVSFDNSSQYLMHEEEGNAGKIYLTINPNNVDFTGLTATLVNSRDEESGIKLGALTKSDKLLSFGVSRSSDDNGFYEANATLTPSEIPNVKVNIESGLKSSLKSVLTDRSVKSFATLANAIYSQLNNYLPAQGIKVGWSATDENGVEQNYAVYSQYNIAATAFKPLSYKFLAGTSSPVTLPTTNPLSGLTIDKDKLHFSIDTKPFEMQGISINFELSEITINTNGTVSAHIVFSTQGVGTNTQGEDITFDIDIDTYGDADMSTVLKQIQDDINSQVTNWNADMKKALDDAMSDLVAQINDQVNDLMDSITGQINDNVDKIVDEIVNEITSNGIFTRLSNYIDKYDSLATRINKVLTNPNHYLQSLLAYSANGSLQLMSTNSNAPSPVTMNGGNAITLYATSYTAELAVPSFYKFVGVTNVWVNGDKNKSAQNGNSGAKSALTAANATQYMATPLNGNQVKVPMKLNSGYTYEIVYSALDYQGVTSTRKYYLKVK